MAPSTTFLKKAGLTAAHMALSVTALSGGANSYYRTQRGQYSPGSAITSELNLNRIAFSSVESKMVPEMQSMQTRPGLELELKKAQGIKELIIVDGNVQDKYLIFKQARPGVDIVEIPAGSEGMVELMKILSGYSNLDAVHIVSHAESGAIHLGQQKIDQKELEEDVTGFAIINNAIRDGGDLMLYGCDVAEGEKGNDFLEIIKNNTHADVAASTDKTGNEAYGGNWELEIQKGDIEATPLPESIAMKDFTGTLQFNGTIDFTQVKTTGSYAGGSSAINAEFYESASKNYTLVVDGESFSTGAYNGAFFQHVYSSSGETAVTLSFSGGEAFDGTNLYMYNSGGSQITFDILSSAGTVASSQTLNAFAGKTLALSTYSNVTGITSLTIDASATMFIKLDNFQVANLGAPVNDNPTISIDNTTLAFTEGDAATQIDPAGTVNDLNGDAEWNGGTLQAQITANNEAGDEISISDTDGDGTAITVSGTNIFANATDIGDLSVSGGVVTNGTALTITFDADATNAIVQEVLQSLRYRNTSDNPGTSNRTVTLTATDKNAGSNNDTRTISVAATNDAPELDNAQSPTLAAIPEDAGDDDGSGADGDDDATNNANNPGTAVASMVVDGSITDPDGSAVEAIAVTNVDNTNGIWQYSIDNGTSWSNFSGTTGSAVDISSAARLLDGTLGGGSTQKIRFVPDANYNGSATITFRAWDKTSGSAGATANATVNGGTTAFSTATDNASITISPVNDDPTASGIPADITVTEDTESNVDLSGITFSDLEGNSLTVTLTASAGTFSTPVDGAGVTETLVNATTVTLVGAAGDINTYLDTATNLKYTGANNVSGEDVATITVEANDGNGSGDVSLGTVNIDITGVNDDPGVSGLPTDITVTEDTESNVDLSPATFTDIDGDNITVTLTVSAGTFSTPVDGAGVTETLVNATTVTLAGAAGDINTYLDTATNLKYTGANNVSGEDVATITVEANDGAGSGDVSLGTVNIDITASNDTPVLAGLDATPAFTEDGSAVTLDGDVTISDEELDALNAGNGNYAGASLTIVRNGGANASDRLSVVSGGNLTVAGGPNGGGTVSAGGNVIGTISNTGNGQLQMAFANNGTIPTTALVNETLQAVQYTNVNNDPAASVQLDWTFSDGNSANTQGTGPNPGTDTGSVTVSITNVNDAPTLTATGLDPTYIEGAAAADLYSGPTANTVETTNTTDRFASMTMIITNVSNGSSEILSIDGSDVALTDQNSVITASNNLTVDVSVSGSTATVSFTGESLTNAEMQTLVDGLGYRNTSDDPSTGANRVVTITGVSDDGGTTNGGSDAAAPNLTSTVSLTGVNDPPVVGNLAGDNTGLEAGGAAAAIDNGGDVTVTNVDSDDYNGGFLTITDNGANNTANGNFSVDGTNVTSNGNGTIAAGETILVGGTAIGTVASAPNDGQGGNTLQINTNGNSTNARVQTLLKNLYWSAAAGSGAQTFTLTLNDADGTANSGDEDVAVNFAMTLGNPPVIANLDGDAVNFLVDGPAVNLDAGTAAGLTDSDNPLNLNGGNLTATVSSGAAASEDILTLDTSGPVLLAGTTAGSNVSVSGNVVGTLANNIAASNDLVVNFTTNDATLAAVASLLQAIQYSSSASPLTEASRQVSVTVTDNDGLASAAATVTVTTVANQPPTLSATGSDPGYLEGGGGTGLFSGATASTTEAGQSLSGLSLTVTNLADGADEILRIDGSDVALTDGNSVTTTPNSLTAAVSVSSTTATLTVSGGSMTPAALQTLVNGLTYRNTSDDPGTTDRVVTITSLTDDGGTANGGDDTASLSIASTVSITPVNDPPTLTAMGSDPTYRDGDAAVALFTGANASTVETGQSFTQLTFLVSNLADGNDEKMTIDGTELALTDGTSATTAGNNLSVSVSVTTGTATVTVSGAGIASSTMNTIIEGLAYRNSSYTPSTGAARVVMLTELTDDGGTANGGVNDENFAVSSVVTVADLVRPAPALVSSNPAAGASGISPTTSVIATFDKDISVVDLSSVSIATGGTPASGVSASLTGTTELTITHSGLAAGATYTVTIPAGAVQNVDGVTNAPISWDFTTATQGPALTLTSPADGATGVDLEEPFSLSYDQRIYAGDLGSISLVAADGTPVTGLSTSIAFDMLNITHPPLATGTTYTLTLPEGAVRNSGEIESAALSLTFTTTIGAPQLLSSTPANGATGVDLQAPIKLRYSQPVSLTDTAEYHLSNAAGQQLSLNATVSDSTLSLAHDGLAAGTTYTLTLAPGALANTEGIPSAGYEARFTTLTAPVAPDLLAPAEGAITATTLALRWRSVEGASYRVQVATDADFTNLTWEEEALSDTSLAIEGLAAGTAYHWRVQAIGTGGASEWSAASFTTQATLPGTPVLLAPADDTTDVPVMVNLRWSSIEVASAYQVQISDVEDFSRLMMNAHLADTSTEAINLSPGQGYWWRVRAKNASGDGPWSSVFRFSTIPDEGIRLAKRLGERELQEDFDSLTVASLDSVFTNLGEGPLTYQLDTDQPLARAFLRGTQLWLAPVPDAFGDMEVAVTAADGAGNSLTDTLSVAITPVNDAPRVALPADTTFESQESVFELVYAPYVGDPESPLEELTVEIQTEQDEIEVSVDTEAGMLRVDAGDFRGLATAELRVSDPDGAVTTRTLRVDFIGTVSTETALDIPVNYQLEQNYPNPFNPSTAISYGLPEAGNVRLEVYNLLGRRVALLAEGRKPAGTYTVRFDASELSSGVYVYRLVAGGQVITRKLTLIK